MKGRHPGRLVVAVGVSLCLSLAGAQKTLVIGVEGGIDTFDPAFSIGSRPTQMLAANVFEPLVQPRVVARTVNGQTLRTVDMTTLQPGLAQSFAPDPANPNRLLFRLRPNVRFHNGDTLDADDVVQTFRRVFESQSPSSFLLTMGGAMKGSSNVTKVDARTVAITMTPRNNLTLRNMSLYYTGAISQRELRARATTQDLWATNFFKKNLGAGTGPYQLANYVPGDTITLKANAGYYRGKPKIDQVILKVIPDPAQRVLLLRTGQLDMADLLPIRELRGLASNPALQVLSFPTTNQERLVMNNAAAPFNKREFRQALAYAIPTELIVRQVYQGYARVPAGPIENGMPGSDPSAWPYRLNVQRARTLLAQAGYPGGRGAPPLTLTIRIGNAEEEQQAVIIQDALAQIGLKVNIQKLALAAFNEQQQGGRLSFFIDNWISWVNDPYYHLFWNFFSGSPTNYGKYKNARVDQIITANLVSGNEAGRLRAAREAARLIGQDVPQIYLASPNYVQVASRRVKNFVYFNDELPRFFLMDKD